MVKVMGADYRHYSEWQTMLKPPAWVSAAAAQQQGWSLDTKSSYAFVTREQYEAALEQAKNHTVGAVVRPATELAPGGSAQDDVERVAWLKNQRRLFQIRAMYFASLSEGGNKQKAMEELFKLWSQTHDVTLLRFTSYHFRLRCSGGEPFGCSGCWAMGRLADLLAEYYEQMGHDPSSPKTRTLVHAQLGQGSDVAWLVLRAMRQRKHRRLFPPWDWERAYASDRSALWAALKRRMSQTGDLCIDNVRVARVGRSRDVRRYREAQARGCCGSVDVVVTIEGKHYRIGFNYGH